MLSTPKVSPNLQPDSRLVDILHILPRQELERFLGYNNGCIAALLAGSCHLLRNRIHYDTALWRQLYQAWFLANPHVVEELEFVYWRTRTGTSASTTPSTSDVLSTLDWFDTYRRRVCAERNWWDGNSKQTTFPMPYPVDFGSGRGIKGYVTSAVITYETFTESFIPQDYAVVEPTGHSSIVHSSNNDTAHLP
jgi:hypothetical protein